MTLPSSLSSVEDCVSLYERGFAGAYPDKAAESRLEKAITDAGGQANAQAAIYYGNFYGSGQNVLSLPYMPLLRMYPGCLPGPAQQRGDCVSWASRTAMLVSYCAGLWYGDNKVNFSPPIVSDAARKSCVFSSETLYWFRGHGGEGWNGAEAANVALTTSGMMPRRNYPEIGIDLTNYSGAIAGKWGANSPPESVVAVTKQHTIGTATVCKGWTDVRDMLANGFAIASAGSEAFAMQRDADGFCPRSNKTWMHALAYIAADDRPETRKKYNCRTGGLVLIQNSWANYCGDWCQIPGTNQKIPPGSFWARWDDISERYAVAFAGGRGFIATEIPHWSLSSVI